MSVEYTIKRYSAYFKGWCQAFGEHESVVGEEREISWLFGEGQIGLILPEELNRKLYRKVLGKHRQSPLLTINHDAVRIGEFQYSPMSEQDKPGLEKLRQLLQNSGGGHLFLTYHFMYKQGTRIITFSSKPPWSLIYKEIGPMQIRLL